MTWREDLRRVTIAGKQFIGASFRGVAFFVETEERSGGRRAVVHEFPLRNDPFVEDLGRRARGFRLDGYVLGDDYLTQKDTLLAALEDEDGPGELVLPSNGVRRAICEHYAYRTSRAEGGIAMFSLEFSETPAQAPTPTEVVDGAEQVSASADAAEIAMDAEFVGKYDPTGLPAFALASAETAIANAAAALQSKLGPIISATQELAQLTGQVALLTAEAASLVRSPALIVDSFTSVIGALVDTALAAPGAMMNALFDAYFADLGSSAIATTATRARELANQTALIAVLRRVFVIEAARLAPLVPYVSMDEALAARDQVATLLDEQAAGADDDAYPAIVNLRSQVQRAVPGGAAFSRITTVNRKTAIPSLLFAYQLYGSVDLELDVVARNKIRHPGFCVGDFKVLSDAT